MISLHDLINRQVAISLETSYYITILHTWNSNQSNRVDIQVLQYVDVSCIWGQDVPGCIYFFLIYVIDSIKGFSRCRGYENILLSICCVCIYVRLVMSSYLLFCCIYFDAWCITCYPKREETLEVYKEWYRISVITLMIGVSHVVEVLVLGLLVVV